MNKYPGKGDVVVIGLRGQRVGALGMWNGRQWFIWRKTNAGMTGEPNNWHLIEDRLVAGWAAIPTGFLHTVIPDGAGPHEPLSVYAPDEPWRLMMQTTEASKRMLAEYDQERQPEVARRAVRRGGTVRIPPPRAAVKRGRLDRVRGKIIEH